MNEIEASVPRASYNSLVLQSDSGSGRCFAILFDEARHSRFASELARDLSASSRVLLLKSELITEDNWLDLVDRLAELLLEAKVRQTSLVGFGGGAALAQAILLRDPKMVRTVAIVDGASRPHPSKFSRFVDAIEHKLPLGLPLRSIGKAFDSRPFLQRIRCPALVATSPSATVHEIHDSDVIADLVPTAWRVHLTAQDAAEAAAQLCEALVLFQEVPARCPQKNLGVPKSVNGLPTS